MRYPIDTNVFIFALKDTSRQVAKRLAATPAEEIALCSVVKAELYHGALKYSAPQRRRDLLDEFLAPYQSLPSDSDCVPHYAAVRHHLEVHGEIIGGNDLMIAAVALAHDLTLVTHNSAEFGRVPGLRWENWV